MNYLYLFSFRNYTGPTNQGINEGRSRNYGSRGQYSPVIEIDEDSHSKFINETSQGGGRSGRGTSVGPGGREEDSEVEYLCKIPKSFEN